MAADTPERSNGASTGASNGAVKRPGVTTAVSTRPQANEPAPLDDPERRAKQENADLQWVRRRNIAFTILCWVAIAGVVLWLASQIYHALIVLVMAAVLA